MKRRAKAAPKKKAIKETLVTLVLDESGSMHSVFGQTVSGFNEYVTGLQGMPMPNRILFSLTKFNSEAIQTPLMLRPIKDVDTLQRIGYHPAACTPLYDAVGQTIRETQMLIRGGRTSPKPSVLFIIMTDGLENSSRQFTQSHIREMILEREADGWTFVYLGANQNAWEVGRGIGMQLNNTASYQSHDTQAVYGAVLASTRAYVNSGSQPSANFLASQKSAIESGFRAKKKNGRVTAKS